MAKWSPAKLVPLAGLTALALCGSPGPTSAAAPAAPPGSPSLPLSHAPLPPLSQAQYIDPRYLTDLPFGLRSHWLQPWRAYQDTPPVSRIQDAVGINLNVPPEQADAICQHLAAHGFRKARIEFGWGSLSWDHPDQLSDPARFDRVVLACKRWGIRPLFLLNAHHGAPTPLQSFQVRLTQPALPGDRTIHLDPATTGPIVPGRSGLDRLTDYRAAEVIFTHLDPDGTVTLSKPLPKLLPVGPAQASTFRFLPFYPSKLKNGAVPPEFEETMAGWLQYVKAITTEASRLLRAPGSNNCGFDLEVWNELTFGSDFLSINNYYQPPLAEGEWAPDEILRRTVAYVNDPANNLPGVGIGNGFNNQWPWGAGSTAPPGLTALDKHPYAGVKRFPADQRPNNQRPVNALGLPEGHLIAPDRWQDDWVPTYVSHFPEYFLSGIQTETLVRDLFPIPTPIGSVMHGRNTHPTWPDGRPAPAPAMWITEVNLDPSGADPGDLSTYRAAGQVPVAPGLTANDADWMKAKAILRYLCSTTNKGPVRFYFFAARDENPMGLGLVSNRLFDYLKANGNAAPPSDTAFTSPTMAATKYLLSTMAPAGPITHPRQLFLQQIQESHHHFQFAGDPATVNQHPNPHPPLYNRDVLGFFPFQASNRSFDVPLYVMTRNLARLYHPTAPSTDPTRFDMPPERYRLTITGAGGRGCRVSMTDILHHQPVPVHLVEALPNQLTIDVDLTDSPRILRIQEPGG